MSLFPRTLLASLISISSVVGRLSAHESNCETHLRAQRPPELPRLVVHFRERIEQELPILSTELSEPGQKLVESMNYTLLAGGKRLRALMAIALAEQVGISFERILPVVRGIEYLHAASLILDDLPAQDNARLRRGRPTNHLAYGEFTAQLAAVSLISESFHQLTFLGKDFSAERVVRVTATWATLLGRDGLSLGQVIDLSPTNGVAIERRHILKTGLGIEASLVVVGILAGWNEDKLLLLKKYSEQLGLLFQLQDDLLDRTSSAAVVGKDVGSDAANQRDVMSITDLEALILKHYGHAKTLGEQVNQITQSTLWTELVQFVVDRKN